MKKKWIALVLVLLLLPVMTAHAAEAGYADSMMPGTYTMVGGDESVTIRSHVTLGGKGGYCQALYAAEITGGETKEELDALALELVQSGAEPVWGGSKHCYHGGAYTVEPEYTLKADAWEPGGYLYVCYAFGCSGGNYNHVPEPYYERICTMAVRVTRESNAMDLSYVLRNAEGEVAAEPTSGGVTELDLLGGALTLEIRNSTEEPNEFIAGVEVSFPEDQAMEAFTFDGTTMELAPVLCGSGTITVTLERYLDGTQRQEELLFNIPCVSQAEPTVMQEDTCTEDGLAVYCCYGHGINCMTEYEQIVLPALGHELFSVSQYVVRPTATLPGIGMGTCKKCGIIGVEQEVPAIFSDVEPESFYSRALDHCYAKGWVTGVTADTFAPGNSCLRAQVVTFLWRAAGCPEPEQTENPFEDVTETDFYYEAVLWAVENGITTGTDATHFSPMGVCNRAQVVTFLWRAMGQPESGSAEHPFKDVEAGSWYEQPVLWAVENGVTSGMSADTFGPGVTCNRAQIVTFLYRAYV